MKRVLAVGVVLIGLLVLALTLKIRAQREAEQSPAGGTGIVEGTEVDVAARIASRVIRVYAKRGQSVRQGERLAELDCREGRARLAEADARIEAARAQIVVASAQARAAARGRNVASATARAARARAEAASAQGQSAVREAARIASLGTHASAQARDLAEAQVVAVENETNAARSQSVATRAQVGVAGAQIEIADAQTRAVETSVAALVALRDLAEIAVSECTIVAPRDGYVEDVYYEEGEVIAPGATLLRLVDLSDVRAIFYLPNAELAEARIGREVELVADAWPNDRFTGHVESVAAEAEFTPRNIQTRSDRDRLVYPIEVRVSNPEGKLRPGMPVEVRLVSGELHEIDTPNVAHEPRDVSPPDGGAEQRP
jgi:HlyD family secretion protein